MRTCLRGLFNPFKVIRVVGRDAEGSISDQRLTDCAQKIFRDDPVPPVTPFWPWIGEQEIKLFHRARRQQITDSIGTFHPQQAHIANVGCLARRDADSTE